MKEEQNKNPHAVALGKRGGEARAKKHNKEKKSEWARKASLIRWAKNKDHE